MKRRADHGENVEEMLLENVQGLEQDVESYLESGISEEDLQALLQWVEQLKQTMKAAVDLSAQPSPARVAEYARVAAEDVRRYKNKRLAALQLAMLQRIVASLSE